VYICVHLCIFVYICVYLCIFVYICVYGTKQIYSRARHLIISAEFDGVGRQIRLLGHFEESTEPHAAFCDFPWAYNFDRQ